MPPRRRKAPSVEPDDESPTGTPQTKRRKKATPNLDSVSFLCQYLFILQLSVM